MNVEITLETINGLKPGVHDHKVALRKFVKDNGLLGIDEETDTPEVVTQLPWPVLIERVQEYLEGGITSDAACTSIDADQRLDEYYQVSEQAQIEQDRPESVDFGDEVTDDNIDSDTEGSDEVHLTAEEEAKKDDETWWDKILALPWYECPLTMADLLIEEVYHIDPEEVGLSDLPDLPLWHRRAGGSGYTRKETTGRSNSRIRKGRVHYADPGYRYGFDIAGRARGESLEIARERFQAEQAERKQMVEQWLDGRRLLKVNGIFYWGLPVTHEVKPWDRYWKVLQTVTGTWYRQDTRLTDADLRIFADLSSDERRKATGEKADDAYVPRRYWHSRPNRQSWKNNKNARKQWQRHG